MQCLVRGRYSLHWSPGGETLAVGGDMRKLALFSLRSRAVAAEARAGNGLRGGESASCRVP